MKLEDIKKSFAKDLSAANDAKALEEIRVKYLGRKDGGLTKILRSLKDLSAAQKKKVGPAANALRDNIEKELKRKLGQLLNINNQLQEGFDVTLPGKKIGVGHLHILTQMENEIRDIFSRLNFSAVEGPEVETEHYNFDALNIPPDHPARDMWDTFWVQSTRRTKTEDVEGKLLRTHTSPVQIRFMESHQPPFQIIVPGRVFRYEATDASHEINFHQVEGLMVGPNVTLANFKYIIETFFKQLFGPEIGIRFRPSYFPFVEPGLEVDIKLSSDQTKLMASRKSEWLEVMGAGMVHPNVFKSVGYDPKKVQGFAFGLGVERLAMIKYKIDDIRLFHSGDLRFINQF
ncbi:MAG: phenylalanine--tRNA ligase subunit alpha [bacterium]|nr:phenylalanine--tRNA ligase subunit alpha [bacterium]